MRDWLPYTAAFGIALASAIAGYFVGFMVVMTTPSVGVAGFFGLVVLIPLAVALLVFVISYAAFADRWLGVQNSFLAAAFVFFTGFACFALIAQRVLDTPPAAALLIVTLFVGGRFLLKRADLV